jgi:hypothetical protein
MRTEVLIGKTDMRIQKLQLAILAAVLTGVMSASAAMVQYTGVSPGQVVYDIKIDFKDTTKTDITESGWAGTYNLKVDGVAMPSFCIDVERNTTTASVPYTPVSLASAPLAWAGPMNTQGAELIQQLWGNYFSGISTAANKNLEAAALQVAIWQAVGIGNGGYTVTIGNRTENLAVATRVSAMWSGLNPSKKTSLIALTNPTYQNFVVVPEPATMIAGAFMLLPLGLSAIRARRKHRTA